MSPGWFTDAARPPRKRYPEVSTSVPKGGGDMTQDVYTGMVTDGSAHLGNAAPGGTNERPKGQGCNIFYACNVTGMVTDKVRPPRPTYAEYEGVPEGLW